MKKRGLYILLFLLFLLALWQYDLLYYGFVQARGQLRIVWGAQPVEELLESPEVADSVKHKLRLIDKAKKFAVSRLGLNPSDNYTSLYDQEGKPLMWVVTACEPFSLTAKEWSFPIVGKFSYKGFFEESMARELFNELEAEGLDVNLRNPGGWSTLGWFKDPVLSNMLLKSDGELAELIIHELTHGTLFVKDSVEFNENLASFIGEEGAKQFLEETYGKDSRQYRAYLQELSDYGAFATHFLQGAAKLDTLYRHFAPDMSDDEKQRQKQALIEEVLAKGDTLHLYDYPRFSKVFHGELPNNAYFMSFLRYRSGQDIFTEVLDERFDKDLRAMIDYFKTEYPSL